MLGGVYGAYENSEMSCPYCKKWCKFDINYCGWVKIPWEKLPPDYGEDSYDQDAWDAAVKEVNDD